MIIPCNRGDHWRRLWVGILLPSARFDIDMFRTRVPSGRGKAWVLHDEANPKCRSDVFFRSAGGERDEDPSLFLDIRITRSARKLGGRKDATAYEEFFRALRATLTGDEPLETVVSLDLVFTGAVRWRVPLMADPPKVVEEKLGLGSVALKGVDLSFEDSPAGLISASLSTAEAQQTVTLFFSSSLSPNDLPDLFSNALHKAEELSALFVTGEDREAAPL